MMVAPEDEAAPEPVAVRTGSPFTSTCVVYSKTPTADHYSASIWPNRLCQALLGFNTVSALLLGLDLRVLSTVYY
jgi:hypothetical protein